MGKCSRSASPKNTGAAQSCSRQIKRDANLEWQAKIRKALESDKGDRQSRAEHRLRIEQERERRIYVGSLGATTTADEIALLFATFGTVKDVIFPKRDGEAEQEHTRRYCFVEFTTKEAAARWRHELVDDYRGKLVQIFDVFGPIVGINFDAARREALVHFFDSAHANSAVATMHGFLIGGHDLRVSLDALNGERPSVLVVLKNLVDAKDLDDDIKDEVFQECKKYGKVKEIRVHVVPQTSEVRIFALFDLPEQANRAVQVFNRRSFAKRKVHCELYDVEAYKKHIFDL